MYFSKTCNSRDLKCAALYLFKHRIGAHSLQCFGIRDQFILAKWEGCFSQQQLLSLPTAFTQPVAHPFSLYEGTHFSVLMKDFCSHLAILSISMGRQGQNAVS